MTADERLAQARQMCKNTLIDHLGIEFTRLGEGDIVATMAVAPRVHQPMGLLHGGASVALAESVGSLGSSMLIDLNTQGVVGLEVNANHLRGKKSGVVTATGKLLHRGKRTHVWEITIADEHDKPVAISRLTIMIIDK